jgi:hypothetical protein
VAGRIRVDEDVVQNQIVAVSYPGQPLPAAPAVTRLVDPAISCPKIKVLLVVWIRRKCTGIAAVWPIREPIRRLRVRAEREKGQYE